MKHEERKFSYAMEKYKCKVCGHVYDEAVAGVPFEELPDDWKCPVCGAAKGLFAEVK